VKETAIKRGGSRVARRLAVAVVLFSSCITLITTGIQVYGDYRHDLSQIDNYFSLIESSHLQSLINNVWVHDDSQIRTQLEGLLRLPDMEHLVIMTDGESEWEAGEAQSKRTIEKSYPLTYFYRGAGLEIGVLHATASLDAVYDRLLNRVTTILISNGIKTFLVSGFVLFVFNRLVTRHLEKLARHVTAIDIPNNAPPLEWDRSPSDNHKDDELDQVSAAINRMQENLSHSVKKLQDSELYNRTLFEQSPIGLVLCRMNGDLVDINPAFAGIIGRSIEETKQLSYWDITPKFYAEAEETQLDSLTTTQRYGPYEKEYIHKDGHLIPVRLSGMILDQKGEQFIWSSVEDISEGKLAQEKLRSSEEKFRIFSQISPVGVFVSDVEGNTTYWNDRICEITGMSTEEGKGVGWADGIHPDDRDRVFNEWYRSTEARENFKSEFRFVDQNGKITWTIGQATPMKNANDELLGFVGSITDITDQKQIEEELKEKNRFISQIIESSALSTWISDEKGTVIRANPACLEFFGATEREVVDKYNLFDDRVIEEAGFMPDIRRVFEEGEVANIVLDYDFSEVDNVDVKSATHKIVNSILTPIVNRDGEVTNVICQSIDLTDIKRAEEELKQHRDQLEETVKERTKELEGFSYSISHDLRAPLRHISGFVGLLNNREKEHLDDTSSRYLAKIAESAGRMGRLIDDLLAFSRTEREEVHRGRVDSNEVVKDVLDELTPMMEGRNIAWIVADLPVVDADRGLLLQIWQNLIDNAIKFTGRCDVARIEIGVLAEETGTGETVFFVRDDGVGFAPQYADKVFGVFQRLHRDDQFEGTGIGLATVHRIVERHGGRIWAEGEKDRGATFFFTLKNAQSNQ